MSAKKYLAVATAALAVVGGASLSFSTANAETPPGTDSNAQSAPSTPRPDKDLFIQTNNDKIKGVKFYFNGQWTGCIATPISGTPVPTNLKTNTETLPLRGFSTDNCYEGEEKQGEPGVLYNSSQIYVAYSVGSFDDASDRVVVNPV